MLKQLQDLIYARVNDWKSALSDIIKQSESTIDYNILS